MSSSVYIQAWFASFKECDVKSVLPRDAPITVRIDPSKLEYWNSIRLCLSFSRLGVLPNFLSILSDIAMVCTISCRCWRIAAPCNFFDLSKFLCFRALITASDSIWSRRSNIPPSVAQSASRISSHAIKGAKLAALVPKFPFFHHPHFDQQTSFLETQILLYILGLPVGQNKKLIDRIFIVFFIFIILLF